MSSRSSAPTQKTASATVSPVNHLTLQRQCACGQHTHGGECEGCKKKRSQQPKSGRGFETVHPVQRSGRSPEMTSPSFANQGPSQDLSRIGLHSDRQAGKSSRALWAVQLHRQMKSQTRSPMAEPSVPDLGERKAEKQAQGDAGVTPVDAGHPAAATCRPLSLQYTNESNLACAAGQCGVKFRFDVTKVNTCSGDDCKGKTVGETVTTDNGCTSGGVDQGPCPNPVGDHNAIPGCHDTYSFCTDPANIPAAGCTETYTVRDNVGGTSAGVSKIVWKFTKTHGNCSATVSRTQTAESTSCS